ncbi:MAG: hypothetical protein LBS67_05805, partial [Clostridiales Family XIII bacterium]|nr:hypothetical protein [Clostridiales Family XIII bacterium]
MNVRKKMLWKRPISAVSAAALAAALTCVVLYAPATYAVAGDGGDVRAYTVADVSSADGTADTNPTRGAVYGKEEVVYAVLSGDGGAEAAYVVNGFR